MNPTTSVNSSSSSESAPLIDWVAFECLLEITQAREDPGALREILAVYEEDAIKALADIESLAHEETRRRLHKLKGASGSITFSAVVAKISILHDPLEAPAPAQRTQMIADIRDTLVRSLTAVRQRYPWLSATEC